VEWQIGELERKGEDFKDNLVLNLKELLILERKRCDKLLINYSLLKKKYEALQKGRSEDAKVLPASTGRDGEKRNDSEKKESRTTSRANIFSWFRS
jgi:hypothetical protein